MRKFLRKSYPAFLLFLTLSFTEIENDEGKTKLSGSWEYIAPDIGMIFQKGAIKFSIEQDVLKGNVIFHDRIIPMQNIIYDKDVVRAHIVFEGEQIDIFMRFQSESFKGTVSHPKGFIRITGHKTGN